MDKGFRASVHPTGFEPVTPSVSGRCANRTALRVRALFRCWFQLCEVETGFEPV